jgi:hypothetical protein
MPAFEAAKVQIIWKKPLFFVFFMRFQI